MVPPHMERHFTEPTDILYALYPAVPRLRTDPAATPGNMGNDLTRGYSLQLGCNSKSVGNSPALI